MTKAEADYQSLQTELDTILFDLQKGDTDIDAAMAQYERGLEVIKLLQARLKATENKITKLKASRA